MDMAVDSVGIEVRDAVGRRVVWLLEGWAEWSRSYRPKLGFPGRGVCGAAASKSFEDLCDECDSTVNHAIDAAVDDLSPAQRAALYRHYGIAAVFRFPRFNYAEQLELAHHDLRRTLPKRGVMVDF